MQNGIDFDVSDESGRHPYNFENNILYGLREFKMPMRSVVTYPLTHVRFQDEWRDD